MSAAARRYQFDDVTVLPDAFRVEKFGRQVSLEPKSIRLLVYLIEHRSRAVGKEELLRAVWPDAAVTDNALTRVVAQLRKALDDHAKVARYIETIPTLGYRFIPQVAELEGDPASDASRAAAQSSIPTGSRRPRPKGAAAVFALAAMIGGVVWLGWRSPVPAAWSGSPLGASVNASYPRVAADGQMLAFRAIVDGEWQLAIMKPDTANWTVLTHDRNRGAVASLAWARDGRLIYFERRFGSGTIYAVPPLGGEPQLILENAMAPEPLPDRSMIVLRPSGGDAQLFRFWPESGRLESLPAWTPVSGYRAVRAFPDGKEAAVLGFYGSPGGVRRLFALDLVSRRARDLASPEEVAGSAGDLQGTIALSSDGQTVYTLWNRDESMQVEGLPRDGSRRRRTLFSYPPGATFLPCDGGPDGSIYMEQAVRQSSVVHLGPAGTTLSETPIPPLTRGVLPSPGGGFVFSMRGDGRFQLLTVKPGSEPRPLLHTIESTRLPGAWMGNGRLAFLIGAGDQVRMAIGSVESGQVLQRFAFDARHVSAIAVGPDSQTLYYASGGAIWEQPVAGGDSRRICEGRDVASDPSGRLLYLKRNGPHGDELFRMPASGGIEKIEVPPGHSLAGNPFSPAAVNLDGEVLLAIQKLDMTFFQAAAYDPTRHAWNILPAPRQATVNSAGWSGDGGVELQITHWSGALWRYRPARKHKAR